MSLEPSHFYGPEAILSDVSQRISEVRGMGGVVDCLTFVADGEPTLDADLAREIEALKDLGITVAVITNGTLLWRGDVAEALGKADWVSVKIDTVDESLWRRVDRPHPGLDLETVLGGIGAFAGERRGTLATETMLIGSMNDGPDAVAGTAGFIGRIAPDTAFIGTPHRPPAERRFRGPSRASLKRAVEIFSERIARVDLLGAEDETFVSTGDPGTDILSISSVHPMDARAISHLLGAAGVGWEVVDDLLEEGKLVKTRYRGGIFFSRGTGGRGTVDGAGTSGK